MAFRPRMTTKHVGISLIGERRAHVSETNLVEVWRARFATGATGHYVSQDPRLFIVLDPLDAEIELDGGPGIGAQRSRTRSASFVPAGAPLVIRGKAETCIRHLDLHFGACKLEELRCACADEARLLFEDPRVQRLARLLEQACGEANGDLYRDGLVSALIAAAFLPAPSRRRAVLADRHLKLAIDYIEEHCAEAIRLEDLAALTGLSQSYFSHAFKAATGVPPHRWQMKAQIRKAQHLLLATKAPVTAIAVETGFSDQAHFTRVFRKLIGDTPAAWRTARD